MLNIQSIEHSKSIVIVLTDEFQKIIWVNNGFELITGYSREEAIGKIPGKLLNGPLTDPLVLQKIRETLLQQKPVEEYIQLYRKNGETYWSEVTIQPIFNTEGKLTNFLSFETDRTQEKLLEEQFEHYKQNLRNEIENAVNAAKEKERYILSQELHDNVNQILTTVKLYIEMVMGNYLENNHLLPRAVQNIQQCIEELRSISRKLALPDLQQTVSLGTQLSDLAESINLTEKINLSYSVEKFVFEPMSFPVQNAIWKTIQEQVSNILKYSKAHFAHIRLWKNDHNLCLHIKDNGVGFNVKDQTNGIGFQNMRQRIVELNGLINIESSPGKGCEINLSIPINF